MSAARSRVLIGALMLAWVGSAVTACETFRDPKPQQAMTDAAISAAVQARLTGDRSSNFTKVDVRSDDGVVSLNGLVPSVQQRARAEELARRVEGVKRVNNFLMIQNPPTRTGKRDE